MACFITDTDRGRALSKAETAPCGRAMPHRTSVAEIRSRTAGLPTKWSIHRPAPRVTQVLCPPGPAASPFKGGQQRERHNVSDVILQVTKQQDRVT